MTRQRVLLVTPFGPSAIRPRMVSMVEHLVRRAELDVVCLDDGTSFQFPPGIHRLVILSNRSKAARILRVALGLVRGIPVYDEYYNSMRLTRVLSRLDLLSYDAIVIHRLPLHRLGPLLAHPNLIYDRDDCDSHKSRLFATQVEGYKGLIYAIDGVLGPRQETAACNAARLVLVTAEREAKHLRDLGVRRPIESWTTYQHFDGELRELRERERFVISFHGKMSYVANAKALQLLNTAIVPRLDPGRFEVRMIGRCSQREQRRYPNLTFTGYVPSIPLAVTDSDLSVFPLPLSVGSPNKVMESLALGVPVIVTPGVMEGLPPVPDLMEKGVWIREVAEFPEQINRFSRLSLEERALLARTCRASADRAWRGGDGNPLWDRILDCCAQEELASQMEK